VYCTTKSRLVCTQDVITKSFPARLLLKQASKHGTEKKKKKIKQNRNLFFPILPNIITFRKRQVPRDSSTSLLPPAISARHVFKFRWIQWSLVLKKKKTILCAGVSYVNFPQGNQGHINNPNRAQPSHRAEPYSTTSRAIGFCAVIDWAATALVGHLVVLPFMTSLLPTHGWDSDDIDVTIYLSVIIQLFNAWEERRWRTPGTHCNI
jgi:hypothetical protein